MKDTRIQWAQIHLNNIVLVHLHCVRVFFKYNLENSHLIRPETDSCADIVKRI